MKKLFYTFLLPLILLACAGGDKGRSEVAASKETFKVLQFNVWQEGTSVERGYEGVISQILQSEADIVMLSEVRNYNDTRFCDRIVQSLKDSGQVFYSFLSYDSGILSRYPIKDSTTVFPLEDDHGSAYRALVDINGTEVAIYTTHLDYLNCTYYDVHGYDGSTWKKRPPMLDLDSILANNTLSLRDDGMKAIIEHGELDRKAGRIVLIGGDFNEPSHLDWAEDTKNIYNHQGLVVPWTVSKMLEQAGYIDTYRELYPSAVTHPGFTFPSQNELKKIEQLTWAAQSDERERIDFIHYTPYEGLKLVDALIWGPVESIKESKIVKEETQDRFMIATGGVWPTDHKAVLATFELSK